MLLLPVLGRSPADSADRVPKLSGFKMFSASLVALISSCYFAAMRTGAFYVTVRKKTIAFRTIGYFDSFWIHIAFFNEPVDNVQSSVVILRIIRCPKSIKVNSKLFESLVKMFVIYFYELTRSDPEFFSVYDNGSAVSVRTADKGNVSPFLSQGTGKNISGHVGPEMPDMCLAISIRQATGDKYGFSG